MASPVADASFLVALLNERDRHHDWARSQAAQIDPPWHTCEAVLSEAFHLLNPWGMEQLSSTLQRGILKISLEFAQHQEHVLSLMRKYRDVPMSLADGCLVRLSELLPMPLVFTADADFHLYRRHSRQVIPTAMPDMH